MSIGRNDACWCGSGKKFKRCHLQQEDDSRRLLWKNNESLRRNFSIEVCLHPGAGSSNCRGGIIRAHTIRRSADLTKIAREGHVYGVISDLATLQKNGGMPLPKLIGIGQASTFTGFCAEHDRATFAPLEVEEFKCTREQAHRLLYRTVVRELYAKQALKRSIPLLRPPGSPDGRIDHVGRDFLGGFDIGVDLAIRELHELKSQLDEDLVNGDYSQLRALIVHLVNLPDVLCAGFTQPDYDFQGVRLQDLGALNQPSVGLGLTFITSEHSHQAVFTWRGPREGANLRLVDSLLRLSRERVPDALVRFAFESFDNVYMRPDWWERLPKSDRDRLIGRIVSGQPFISDQRSHLEDDGSQLTDNRVIGIYRLTTNGLTHICTGRGPD